MTNTPPDPLSNPFVAASISQAKTFGEWLYAQIVSVASANKIVAGVIFGCGFVAGCIIH